METLALHQANAPQFYPECVQLIVGGSGTALPPAEYQVSIPGAWSASDPGVMVDIYSDAAKTQTTYIIPGPRIWPGFTGIDIPSGSNPTTTPGGTTTTPGGTTTTTTTKTTTTTTTTTSGPKQTHYGQCGGQGYSGPTVCEDPYKCTVSSQYYSQHVMFDRAEGRLTSVESEAALTALAAFLVSGAQAHGGVTSWSIGSTTYPGWQPYLPASQQSVTAGRPYTSYDPILNPTASTIHCNDDGNAGPNPTSININPGDTI
ncbi:hypothetical protein FS837_007992, partial [Tulasnella sp. UAMH 9824]